MGENVYVGGYRDKKVHQFVEELKREDRCEMVKMFTGNDGDRMYPMMYTYAELKCPMGTLEKYKDKKYVSKRSHYEMNREIAKEFEMAEALKRADRKYGRKAI